jgi:hypothetical protein
MLEWRDHHDGEESFKFEMDMRCGGDTGIQGSRRILEACGRESFCCSKESWAFLKIIYALQDRREKIREGNFQVWRKSSSQQIVHDERYRTDLSDDESNR